MGILPICNLGFFAGYRPWKIIYTKEISSKQEAIAHEKWSKSGSGRDFIKSLAH